ncbi:MAG: CHAT domain-containing protein, partial [Pontixanthobacter sp.]
MVIVDGFDRGNWLGVPQRLGNVAVLSPGDLRSSLTYLPGTRDELIALASALGADAETDLLLANDAREARLRNGNNVLSDRRIIAFATHGLIATDGIANLDEPGLVLTPPLKGSIGDDGFLAASEIAASLKLDADWVILSACNTASPAKSGAESLSGLARAFFYAGARSLLVSHWPVEDDIAARITVKTITAYEANTGLRRA